MGFSVLVRQLVLEKENSEFKVCLKIDLVLYLARAEGLVNIYIYEFREISNTQHSIGVMTVWKTRCKFIEHIHIVNITVLTWHFYKGYLSFILLTIKNLIQHWNLKGIYSYTSIDLTYVFDRVCDRLSFRPAGRVWEFQSTYWENIDIIMLQRRNHAWTRSHHLMKALLEAMLLYKHQLLYDT